MDTLQILKCLGIREDVLTGYQVVCLPENSLSAGSKDEWFDASDAAPLSKLLKSAGLKCANSYDLGLVDLATLDRRGEDRWFGTVWIRDYIAVPLVVGTIASLIAAEIHEHGRQGVPQPIPRVHLHLLIGSSGQITDLDYHGDGETLVRLLSGAKTGTSTNEPPPSH
jgi:hypothetical protein